MTDENNKARIRAGVTSGETNDGSGHYNSELSIEGLTRDSVLKDWWLRYFIRLQSPKPMTNTSLVESGAQASRNARCRKAQPVI